MTTQNDKKDFPKILETFKGYQIYKANDSSGDHFYATCEDGFETSEHRNINELKAMIWRNVIIDTICDKFPIDPNDSQAILEAYIMTHPNETDYNKILEELCK